jgi:hypothetical protein
VVFRLGGLVTLYVSVTRLLLAGGGPNPPADRAGPLRHQRHRSDYPGKTLTTEQPINQTNARAHTHSRIQLHVIRVVAFRDWLTLIGS